MMFLNGQVRFPLPPPTSIATVYVSKVGLNSVDFFTVGCDDLIFVENCFEFS